MISTADTQSVSSSVSSTHRQIVELLVFGTLRRAIKIAFDFIDIDLSNLISHKNHSVRRNHHFRVTQKSFGFVCGEWQIERPNQSETKRSANRKIILLIECYEKSGGNLL